MQKKFSAIIYIVIILLLGGVAAGVYAYRFKFYEYRIEKARERLPRAITKLSQDEKKSENEINTNAVSLATTSTRRVKLRSDQEQKIIDLIRPVESTKLVIAPDELNLSVPFMVQAPFAIWDALHEDACEEASVAMVARYYKNQSIAGPDDADEEIKKITAWENEHFGFNKDTSAALAAEILKQYYNFEKVQIKYDEDVSIESIKKTLSEGKPIIVPNYGRALRNPFFRSGGPTYHMLVIKGYTKDGKFIVNDPGTKRGADFVYPEERLHNAINDWDDENARLSGRKAMIVVG